MEECVFDVELVNMPIMRESKSEDNTNGGWLDNGIEGLIKVDARSLCETTKDPADFVREPYDLYLWRRIHFPVTIFALEGRGTRSQV